jgi:hypothetical protein
VAPAYQITENKRIHLHFACNFGFQQEFSSYSALPGVDEPFFESSPLGEDDDGPYYLVAGSNQEDPIQVNTTTVSENECCNPQENPGSTVEGDANPFKHFPGELSDQVRNPYEVWDQTINK